LEKTPEEEGGRLRALVDGRGKEHRQRGGVAMSGGASIAEKGGSVEGEHDMQRGGSLLD